ncbi:TetR/AcrR family transcriptional regulator [Streptomyces sp. RG38]|uniref:TetR/AcrR family transcriptional regulator n=1 Tax=Streptomyces tagetis TaxID=2820809 RepID=A0A941AZR7_9ACTN|nr:TetR/AcrR family transcriptional regulator [Streptomyces sp. RG38]
MAPAPAHPHPGLPRRPGPFVTPRIPARADARRNREKLLAAARSAFTVPTDTVVPLETIARAAGVGIGTLYRHFPHRRALVEAVYAAELDEVTAEAPALLAALPPDAALRAWLDRYARFAAARSGPAGTVPDGAVTEAGRVRVTGTVTLFLAAGARTGALRRDVDADDAVALLLGVLSSPGSRDTPERTGRLLDLVVDALRPHAAPYPASERQS